jgi:hypothetical protein
MEEESAVKMLPDDPLVRWVFWFVVAVTFVIPVLAALVIALES